MNLAVGGGDVQKNKLLPRLHPDGCHTETDESRRETLLAL